MTAKDFNRCLRLIAKGNNSGMSEIYNNYYAKLLLTARLEVNSSFIAEDIASNVLLSIFENAANYKTILNPDAWMYKSVIFAIINYKRNNEKYVYSDFIEEQDNFLEEKLNLKIEVYRLLAKLPERQRQIVQLHFVYGLKLIDTARTLKISYSTVCRDIRLLREELKNFKNFIKE